MQKLFSDFRQKHGKRFTRKPIRSFLLPLFLLVTVFTGLYAVKKSQEIRKFASSKKVSLSFTPEKIQASSGEPFTEGVVLDTGDKTVSATELHIQYNPAKIELQTITPGNFLSVQLAQPTIGSGIATIFLGSDPQKPQKGTGVISTLKFKSLSSSSQISFTQDTKVAAIETDGNVVDEMTPATINQSGSPTVPPLPSGFPGLQGTIMPPPSIILSPLYGKPTPIPPFSSGNIPTPPPGVNGTVPSPPPRFRPPF